MVTPCIPIVYVRVQVPLSSLTLESTPRSHTGPPRAAARTYPPHPAPGLQRRHRALAPHRRPAPLLPRSPSRRDHSRSLSLSLSRACRTWSWLASRVSHSSSPCVQSFQDLTPTPGPKRTPGISARARSRAPRTRGHTRARADARPCESRMRAHRRQTCVASLRARKKRRVRAQRSAAGSWNGGAVLVLGRMHGQVYTPREYGRVRDGEEAAARGLRLWGGPSRRARCATRRRGEAEGCGCSASGGHRTRVYVRAAAS